MDRPNTTCRVCRKEYFCCSDSRRMHSWREVACSPECYKEYIRRIDASRKAQGRKDEKGIGEQEEVAIIKPQKRKKNVKVDIGED